MEKKGASAPPEVDTSFVAVKEDGDTANLVLHGEWTVENAASIAQAVLAATQKLGRRHFKVVGKDIAKLDTTGALLLKKLIPDDADVHLNKQQQALLDFLPAASERRPAKSRSPPAVVQFFCTIGKGAILGREFMWEIFVFVGKISLCALRNVLHPRRFRLPSVVRHIQEAGLNALSIVGLLAILISMVITYQGAVQLRKFGADIYTVDLTVIALLREMSVLVTSIMVAGRSGSAFAAEIGVMKLREEVSALRTMGMDPIEVLVLPRVIALMITLPLLTFLADIIGLAGGGLMSLSLLNISFHQYLSRVHSVADVTMFFVGMIKAPVFAAIIAVVGCYQGLKVSGSAEDIGKRTTLAVVEAIFVVIMADALFSVFFSKVGI